MLIEDSNNLFRLATCLPLNNSFYQTVTGMKMIGILDEAGSREFSESKAREMADQAMAALDGFESETRSALEGLAHWALDGPA